MHAIGPLTGVNPEDSNGKFLSYDLFPSIKAKLLIMICKSCSVAEKPVSFTVFTGDLVSHDNDNQLSRAYIEYAESATYQLYKEYLGGGPVYAALVID